MAVFLITILALGLVAGNFRSLDLSPIANWNMGGEVLAAAICSILAELSTFRAILSRSIPASVRIRPLALSLRWVGFNALIAAACGFGLVLLLLSPLLDRLGFLAVMVVAGLAEFVGVVLVAGLAWHKRVVGGPVTWRALALSAGRFALLNGVSVVTFVLVANLWFTGCNYLVDRRHHARTLAAQYQATKPCADTSAIVVAKLDKSLPSDPKKLRKFLWDNFANKPAETQFSGCTTENWETRYWLFASALVNRARISGLDAAALERCLKSVFPHGGSPAYLPVGAYQTRQKRAIVWVIVVKWEGVSPQTYFPLVHIRVYAFEAESGRQIGYVTCM
jgi:hypothetical protein